MTSKRLQNFPGPNRGQMRPDCKVATAVNAIRKDFLSDMSTIDLKQKARIAMGARQFCPKRKSGKQCMALRYKHYVLTLILDKIDDRGVRINTTETQTAPQKTWGCMVCFDNILEKTPMALEYGHMLCSECSGTLSKLDTNIQRKRKGKVQCPACKHESVPM